MCFGMHVCEMVLAGGEGWRGQGFPHGGGPVGGLLGAQFLSPPIKFLAPPWPPHLGKNWPPHQKFDGGAGGASEGAGGG